MYIYSSNNKIDNTKLVNIVGKSLYKRLDGAYSFKKLNGCSEVKSTVLYQIPKMISDRYNLPKEQRDNVQVMDITINVTTYSDKIRVEVIEISPEEKTIGFKTFRFIDFNNVQQGCEKVYSFITSSIKTEFEGYEVLF